MGRRSLNGNLSGSREGKVSRSCHLKLTSPKVMESSKTRHMACVCVCNTHHETEKRHDGYSDVFSPMSQTSQRWRWKGSAGRQAGWGRWHLIFISTEKGKKCDMVLKKEEGFSFLQRETNVRKSVLQV